MKTTTKPKDFEHNTREYPLVLMHPEDYYPDPFEDLEREARRYGLVAKRVTPPMSPIGSSRRRLLNQSTHSRVAYSTSSILSRNGASDKPGAIQFRLGNFDSTEVKVVHRDLPGIEQRFEV